MRLGCAIIIQASGRQHLARKRARASRTSVVFVYGAALALRQGNACKKIQTSWRHLVRSRVEKAAGLVIERFFLMVEEEVDREIRRREKRQTSKSKREKRRRHRKEPEDKLLERAWLNTVDENTVDLFEYPVNCDSKSFGADSRSKSAPRLRISLSTDTGVSFHPSVASLNRISAVSSRASSFQRKEVNLLSDNEQIRSEELVQQKSTDDTTSDISGATSKHVFSHRSRQTLFTQKELSDDLTKP